jgi:hypothetical protein
MLKFKRRTVQVWMSGGSTEPHFQPVEAYTAGPLACHKDLEVINSHDQRNPWSIFHIPTGYLIKTGYRTLADCRRVIERLLAMPHDWNDVTVDNCRAVVDVAQVFRLLKTDSQIVSTVAGAFKSAEPHFNPYGQDHCRAVSPNHSSGSTSTRWYRH